MIEKTYWQAIITNPANRLQFLNESRFQYPKSQKEHFYDQRNSWFRELLRGVIQLTVLAKRISLPNPRRYCRGAEAV